MRTVFSGLCAMCVFMAAPGTAAEFEDAPKGAAANADQGTPMQAEAVGDRWPDRWRGRQHYLFDADNPAETTASGQTADARRCAGELVRVRRADGSTTVTRTNRCR
jgi:hypothetical protein